MSDHITGTYRSDDLSVDNIKSIFLRKLNIEFQQAMDVDDLHFCKNNSELTVRIDHANRRLIAAIKSSVLSNPENRKVQEDPILKALYRYCNLPESIEPELLAIRLEMLGQDAAAMIVREKVAHMVVAEAAKLFHVGNKEQIIRICPHVDRKCENTHLQWLAQV